MGQIDKFINLLIAKKKIHFWLFFSLLCSLTLLMMYLYYPLQPGHDFFFHYRRLQALMDGLNSPYLMYLDYNAMNGYGYFTKAFYSDITLIPFAWIGNLTSLEFGYLSLIFVTTILCGVFTYIAAKRVFKSTYVAVISAFLYTFCFYRLLDLYHRASIGEVITFTFLPIVFLGLYHIIKGDYKKWYILSIGFILMIFTHLISSVLAFFTVVFILLIYYKSLLKEPKRFYYLLLSGFVALLITSYYFLPMLEQMQSNSFYFETRNITVRAQDSLFKMNWIIWGLFSGIVQARQLFIPGTGLLLTLAIGMRLLVYGKSKELKSLDILVILGLIYISLSSIFFPWSIFPFNKLNFIQIPWRLFEFSSLFFSVAGAYYIYKAIRSKKRLIIAVGLIVIATVMVMTNDAKLYHEIRSLRSINQPDFEDEHYHMAGIEYIPDKVPSVAYIRERGSRIDHSEKISNISNYNKEKGITSFSLTTTGEATVELPLFYYKGYSAMLDNKELKVSESPKGLVQISTETSGDVKVYYAGTFVQKLGWYLTILSIFVLSVYIYFQRKRISK